MAQYIVELASEDFGCEDFKYDSLKEAKEGFQRLVRDITKANGEDQVDRTLRLFTIHDTFNTAEEGEHGVV